MTFSSALKSGFLVRTRLTLFAKGLCFGGMHSQDFLPIKVTYKTASALLELKTQDCKEILDKFVKECSKQSNKSLYVTYLVGGTKAASKKLLVVDASNYEKVKADFENVFIDQIYSVQKSKAVSWESIFNLNDFLYSEQIVTKPVQNTVTESKESTEKQTEHKEKSPAKAPAKKGGISNFFNQSTATKTESKPQEKKPAPKKEEKKNDIKNLFSKVKPKEIKKETVAVNGNHKNSDDEEDDIVTKKNVKKRGRIIDDDDLEEEIVVKHMKADILDSDNESEKENIISEDESEKEECEKEKMEVDKQPSDVEEVVEPAEEPVKKEEPKEMMYEDDDGFFVTQKSTIKKTVTETKPKTEAEKNEIKQQMKVEKQSKKEISAKLKKNTNQKTLFNFYKKM